MVPVDGDAAAIRHQRHLRRSQGPIQCQIALPAVHADAAGDTSTGDDLREIIEQDAAACIEVEDATVVTGCC